MAGQAWKYSGELDERDLAFLVHEFITVPMGIEYYGFSERPLIRMAKEAGAFYKIGKAEDVKEEVIMAEPTPAARNYDSSALQKKINTLEHRFSYNYIYPSDELTVKQAEYIKRAHKIMKAKLPTYEDFIDFSSKYLSENSYFDERVYFIAELVYTKKNAAWFIPLTNINLFNTNQPWLVFCEFDNFIEAVKRL